MLTTKKKLIDKSEFDMQINQIVKNKNKDEIDQEITFDKFTSKDKTTLIEML